MSYEKEDARAPDYKGEGVAVWKNYTKDGKLYLSIKILGNINLNAWKNEPKPQAPPTEEI